MHTENDSIHGNGLIYNFKKYTTDILWAIIYSRGYQVHITPEDEKQLNWLKTTPSFWKALAFELVTRSDFTISEIVALLKHENNNVRIGAYLGLEDRLDFPTDTAVKMILRESCLGSFSGFIYGAGVVVKRDDLSADNILALLGCADIRAAHFDVLIGKLIKLKDCPDKVLSSFIAKEDAVGCFEKALEQAVEASEWTSIRNSVLESDEHADEDY